MHPGVSCLAHDRQGATSSDHLRGTSDEGDGGSPGFAPNHLMALQAERANLTSPAANEPTRQDLTNTEKDGRVSETAKEAIQEGGEAAMPPGMPPGMPSPADLTAGQGGNLLFEASQQVEQILAEGADFGSVSDGFDDGYESDTYSSASTSVGSSVRDFAFENGWRYHRFREGAYNFPNDDVEQEREDMKHAMVKLLCGQKLHFAPIGDNPQEILDIGTGTGIWPIEMGDLYPSARILGIDLSPIQPDWLPPNVRFVVDDAESTWLYPNNHFDYVHARHSVMAIRDWPKLFRQAFQHLKPGGWIEMQEVHHHPRSAHPTGNVPPDHPVAKFWANVTLGLEVLGVHLNIIADGCLTSMMQEAGFVNVTERILHIPIGTWPKNRVQKAVGLYWRTILLDGLQAIGLGPFTRGLKWNRDEVELFTMEVRRAYFDDGALMYMPFHILQAQKPPRPF